MFDLEKGYKDHLQELMPGAELKLGKQEGDITLVPLDNLERPVHAVISGPPCPPWSSAGKQDGQLDDRNDVLVYVLRLIVAVAAVGELQFGIIENVVGIAHGKHEACRYRDYINNPADPEPKNSQGKLALHSIIHSRA